MNIIGSCLMCGGKIVTGLCECHKTTLQADIEEARRQIKDYVRRTLELPDELEKAIDLLEKHCHES